MWDEFQQQHFNLRAMLFVTTQDGPALGSILGQAFKGYKGCTWSMDKTSGIWLKHCKKVVYMGHRRFLLAEHPYRKNKKAFDGTIEVPRFAIFTSRSEAQPTIWLRPQIEQRHIINRGARPHIEANVSSCAKHPTIPIPWALDRSASRNHHSSSSTLMVTSTAVPGQCCYQP
jgi:hypothetical protein